MSPEWHREACRLFAQGMTVAEIARKFCVAYTTAQWVVDDKNARVRYLERKKKMAAQIAKRRGTDPIRLAKISARRDLVTKVCALKGTKSAAWIAHEFALASRNVVIGIWRRYSHLREAA